MWVRAALAIGCALSIAACEATATHSAARPLAHGDLPAALPAASPGVERAHTGAPARVVLGARRERAAELLSRYLHRLAERDADGLGAMFADPVTDPDTGETHSREDEVRLHERLLQADPAALSALATEARPVVRSLAELRRMRRAAPAWMQPDDWLLETNAREVPSSLSIWLPRRFVVRWYDDAPIFVGISRIAAIR